MYATPGAAFHWNDAGPLGIVAPGGGLVITAAAGAVCNASVCGSACTVAFPAVNVSVAFVPGAQPAVNTQIFAIG